MRDYVPKSSALPRSLYRRAKTFIQDYPRMCAMRDALVADREPAPLRLGGKMHAAVLSADIEAVDRALSRIPGEYRQGVMDNLLYGVRLIDLDGASERTWQRQRESFLRAVAEEKNWL